MAGYPVRNANWNDVLSNVNPFGLASVGAAIALTFCVIGAAWCVHAEGRAPIDAR